MNPGNNILLNRMTNNAWLQSALNEHIYNVCVVDGGAGKNWE